MTLSTILISIFEVALVAFTLWALFNEDHMAAFERKIFYKLRRRLFIKVVKPAKSAAPHHR